MKNPEKDKAKQKKYRSTHPKVVKHWNITYNKNRIKFKGKSVQLRSNPRKGICSICGRSVAKGEIKVTNMHHMFYDENNPLEGTVELCVDCHNQQHPRTRNYLQQYIQIQR